jgi:NADPH:quinone reductase-like Zn-dependent oxidoreductase
MKAVVCTRYGPPEVLQLRELEEPAPKDDEVRIKIHATAVTSSDCIVRSFSIPAAMWIPGRLVLGITKPRSPVLGMVLAGEIEGVGKDVGSFIERDQVFGFDRFDFGAYAEYKCMPESRVLTSKPSNLSYEEAAAIPYGGMLALHFLRRGQIRSGQRALVYGASGAVGTSAVQLAKHFGADVTGVCSTANLGLVRSLGADEVIDYTKDDFTKSGERYHLIFVAVGDRVNPPSKADCKNALAADGAYVSEDQGTPKLLTEDLILLKQLVEEGKLKPVIDRSYPLEQIAEAHRYVDKRAREGECSDNCGLTTVTSAHLFSCRSAVCAPLAPRCRLWSGAMSGSAQAESASSAFGRLGHATAVSKSLADTMPTTRPPSTTGM